MSVPALVSPAGTLHAVIEDHPTGPRTHCGLPCEPDWEADLDVVGDACNSCFTPAQRHGRPWHHVDAAAAEKPQEPGSRAKGR